MESTLFDFLDARILTLYDSMKSILAGKMPAPRTAIFYPSYVCNQACPGCEYQDDNKDINTLMDGSDMRRLLGDLVDLDVKGVELCGGGEPTLHPDLADTIAWLHGMGVKTGLLTNGTLIKGKLLDSVVKCSSYMRVGFDAASPETFNKAKCPNPGAGFDVVVENVRNAIGSRNKLKSNLTISMKYLVSKFNADEIVDAVQLAQELGMDSIQFKAVRVYHDLFDKDVEKTARDKIAEARERFPDYPILGGVDKLDIHTKCWLTPVQVMVDTLGDVYLCCYYRHRKKSLCIGNALETPIKELWYGERHFEAIKKINPSECNNLDCRFVRYNKMMDKLIKEELGQFEFI